DEPHDAPVRYPVLDELHQHLVVDGVEEATDVGIEHPVHPSRLDPDTERIECVMRLAPWPKSMGKAEEVHLVDAVQDHHEGTLDQLVLERGDPEWPLASVRFRDIHPPDRLRSVRPPLQPLGEIVE